MQHNKSRLWQTHGQHDAQQQKLKAFLLKSTLTIFLFDIVLEDLASEIRQEKEYKDTQIEGT